MCLATEKHVLCLHCEDSITCRLESPIFTLRRKKVLNSNCASVQADLFYETTKLLKKSVLDVIFEPNICSE